ncbi:MAG TPA: carboxy-S-adenosyl-L-methionine synthase CmoA [Methylophaga aminisulfidivorans]|uniref:Carboxy-S-adenosyl-L-methionine synthase n=1 Tax=Methylophaga aminisulfidivorans TaxID=230105 RepID=A0A7C1ZTX2_9GAMM|nr:carboxy-S-adenosyl-L-methionine synthase CmoA [Methylophaga aminisulfidivorans]
MWLRKKGSNSVRKQDNIYAAALDQMVDFRFDEKVVDVFPDMIQRSVPGYATMISTIGVLAAKYAQADTKCYDLGCSLGAVTLSMRHRIKQQNCNIIAVDNSPAMTEKAANILAADTNSQVKVDLVCADIADIDIQNASVVVMNFTLQFIPIEQRQTLVNKIYQGLEAGGVLILSEKLAFDDNDVNQFHIDSHHDFKRDNGYSDMEISQKRSALEKVLIPESLAQHQQRLNQAGFNFVEKWFQCFNFVSMVAIK